MGAAPCDDGGGTALIVCMEVNVPIIKISNHLSSMANTTSTPPALPSYKQPPVTEVSFGAIFKPLDNIQMRHFGQFWEEQRADYPTTSDLGPLLDVSDVETQILNLPPLRRMMCFSEDQQFVVQIQDRRLHLNWRRVKPQDVDFAPALGRQR